MLHSLLPRMFHVKHPDASPGRTSTVFHVKHRRRLLAGALLSVALFGTACANIQRPEGWAAPADVDGDVLVQTSTGQVSLVDPASGSIAWSFPNEDKRDHAFYATPIVDGDAAYLADYAGRIARVSVTDASEAWAVDLGAHVVATPILDGDTLYVATADGRIVLIDAATGTVGETLRTSDRRIWGSPAFQGGTLYIGDLDNGTTVAIDATSGDVVWEQEISGPSAADLLLDGDLLIVGAFDQHLHALEVANGGQERWAFPGDGWFLARPLVSDGIVYAATMNGVVYAIDRATGAEVWSFVAGEDAEFRAAPVIAAGHLIAIARDGRVFALDLQSGDVAWQQDATLEGNVNANPTVVDSDIYLVTSRHELVRVDASSNGAFQTVPLAAAGQ